MRQHLDGSDCEGANVIASPDGTEVCWMHDRRLQREVEVDDHVIINVPHLGMVAGTVKALGTQPCPSAAVLWLTGNLEVVECNRLRDNGVHGWYLEQKS